MYIVKKEKVNIFSLEKCTKCYSFFLFSFCFNTFIFVRISPLYICPSINLFICVYAVTNTLAQDYVVKTNNSGKWRNFVTQCQLAAEHLMKLRKAEHKEMRIDFQKRKVAKRPITRDMKAGFGKLTKYIKAGINLELNPTAKELFDFMVTFFFLLDYTGLH